VPFVEKYRPENLDRIISHVEIVKTSKYLKLLTHLVVRKFIESKKLPHLLFHGPPGTGKTSCMIAIAKELYGSQYRNMTLELNASDDRGIGVVRDQIKSFCSTQQLMSKGMKLVILDESDSMTGPAQFALRRIVEKYSKTTRFCFICNFVSKIIPALQSRCTRFRFGPL
jgi:replication factor C subunit 3/5